MNIVVTGASGFAGGRIARRLAEAGHDVLGVGRRPIAPGITPARYRSLDLLDPETSPMPADIVVNAAATTDETAPLALALAHNRDIPARLPMLFPGARIIHISSSSVADVDGPRLDMRESDAPATRWLGSYPASKWAGDREALAAGALVLRPHAIYGPGDRTLMPRLERLASLGLLPLPDGGASQHTLTHVDSLADAVLAAVARCERGGHAYRGAPHCGCERHDAP